MCVCPACLCVCLSCLFVCLCVPQVVPAVDKQERRAGEPAGTAVSKSSKTGSKGSTPGGASGGTAVGKCFKHENCLFSCSACQVWVPTHDHVTRPSRHTCCCCHAQKQSPPVPIPGHAHAHTHACMLSASPSANLLLLDARQKLQPKPCQIARCLHTLLQVPTRHLLLLLTHSQRAAATHNETHSPPCNNCFSSSISIRTAHSDATCGS